MENDSILALLAIGPAGAIGLYWMLYRFYRNTDKSHAFEHETTVQAQPVTGAEADSKVDEIRGTRETRIRGENGGEYRRRVRRL